MISRENNRTEFQASGEDRKEHEENSDEREVRTRQLHQKCRYSRVKKSDKIGA